ncbi:hypothetical protein ADUPG1_008286 [Aduncisulcus paluster]|uniref:Uncharacterized protein n=1 Tax=Aduncisulcus paluster TaxID=2918883 RepID=A0ABQ5KSQ6_9EUKA|nr:hypothetical protein ADUPG1_008286 [Aduncisulcus paluster]
MNSQRVLALSHLADIVKRIENGVFSRFDSERILDVLFNNGHIVIAAAMAIPSPNMGVSAAALHLMECLMGNSLENILSLHIFDDKMFHGIFDPGYHSSFGIDSTHEKSVMSEGELSQRDWHFALVERMGIIETCGAIIKHEIQISKSTNSLSFSPRIQSCLNILSRLASRRCFGRNIDEYGDYVFAHRMFNIKQSPLCCEFSAQISRVSINILISSLKTIFGFGEPLWPQAAGKRSKAARGVVEEMKHGYNAISDEIVGLRVRSTLSPSLIDSLASQVNAVIPCLRFCVTALSNPYGTSWLKGDLGDTFKNPLTQGIVPSFSRLFASCLMALYCCPLVLSPLLSPVLSLLSILLTSLGWEYDEDHAETEHIVKDSTKPNRLLLQCFCMDEMILVGCGPSLIYATCHRFCDDICLFLDKKDTREKQKREREAKEKEEEVRARKVEALQYCQSELIEFVNEQREKQVKCERRGQTNMKKMKKRKLDAEYISSNDLLSFTHPFMCMVNLLRMGRKMISHMWDMGDSHEAIDDAKILSRKERSLASIFDVIRRCVSYSPHYNSFLKSPSLVLLIGEALIDLHSCPMAATKELSTIPSLESSLSRCGVSMETLLSSCSGMISVAQSPFSPPFCVCGCSRVSVSLDDMMGKISQTRAYLHLLEIIMGLSWLEPITLLTESIGKAIGIKPIVSWLRFSLTKDLECHSIDFPPSVSPFILPLLSLYSLCSSQSDRVWMRELHSIAALCVGQWNSDVLSRMNQSFTLLYTTEGSVQKQIISKPADKKHVESLQHESEEYYLPISKEKSSLSLLVPSHLQLLFYHVLHVLNSSSSILFPHTLLSILLSTVPTLYSASPKDGDTHFPQSLLSYDALLSEVALVGDVSAFSEEKLDEYHKSLSPLTCIHACTKQGVSLGGALKDDGKVGEALVMFECMAVSMSMPELVFGASIVLVACGQEEKDSKEQMKIAHSGRDIIFKRLETMWTVLQKFNDERVITTELDTSISQIHSTPSQISKIEYQNVIDSIVKQMRLLPSLVPLLIQRIEEDGVDRRNVPFVSILFSILLSLPLPTAFEGYKISIMNILSKQNLLFHGTHLSISQSLPEEGPKESGIQIQSDNNDDIEKSESQKRQEVISELETLLAPSKSPSVPIYSPVILYNLAPLVAKNGGEGKKMVIEMLEHAIDKGPFASEARKILDIIHK